MTEKQKKAKAWLKDLRTIEEAQERMYPGHRKKAMWFYFTMIFILFLLNWIFNN